MNAVSPLAKIGVVILGLACLLTSSSAVLASSPCGDAGSSTLILQANFILEFASDRTRLIQGSLGLVAFGCAAMWWYR